VNRKGKDVERETRFRFIRMGRGWECSEKEALAISAFEWPWGAPRLLLV